MISRYRMIFLHFTAISRILLTARSFLPKQVKTNQNRFIQSKSSSRLKPPCLAMDFLRKRCTSLIASIGFSESRSPFVSDVGWTSSEQASPFTRSEWAFSPSWMIRDPFAMRPPKAPTSLSPSGFPLPQGIRTVLPLESLAVATQKRFLERPLGFFPSWRTRPDSVCLK